MYWNVAGSQAQTLGRNIMWLWLEDFSTYSRLKIGNTPWHKAVLDFRIPLFKYLKALPLCTDTSTIHKCQRQNPGQMQKRFLMGSSYRDSKTVHRFVLQPVHALLTGLILKRSNIYSSWTVILLPFKLAACKQLFPKPTLINGMTKMLLQSTKSNCVLWLHSMRMLTHSIQDTVIKVNLKSHIWTHWAASMWYLKNGREKKNKMTCWVCLKNNLHPSANLQCVVHHPIISSGTSAFDTFLSIFVGLSPQLSS